MSDPESSDRESGTEASDPTADVDPDARDATADYFERAATVLERARTEPAAHAVTTVAAVAVGLVVATVHWFGLVVGGALVATVAPSLRRAVVAGVGFGMVVLVAFALTLGAATWTVLETTPVVYLTVAAAIGLPVLGSLSRGLY